MLLDKKQSKRSMLVSIMNALSYDLGSGIDDITESDEQVQKKILSLGAGVQSSACLLMSCYGELDRLDAAIFADTGWETKATYRWLEFLKSESEKYGIPIHVVKGRDLKQDALVSQVRGLKSDGNRHASMPLFTLGPNGEKGMIKRQCTSEYKLRVIEKKQREIAGYKKYARIPTGAVEVWVGISTDEANRAKISDKKWYSFYYPLIELRMSRRDCRNWFAKNGLPQPPRSSCIGCPYHSDKEWRHLRDNSPDEWQEAVEFDRAIRKCGGMRGDVFIHSQRVPLDQVDLRTDQDKGQLSLFRNECAGVCGV